ncbi:MAG: glycoside hydrolase family 88 protein, partial [Thermomicrobiales bacterium]|nr:glycoside hydrolase family 88 protein [Thermomicrobiales bacterium]
MSENERNRYDRALDYCVAKTRLNLDRLDAFPHTTRDGRWRTSEHGRWTAGHWIGVIWLAYLRTGDPDLREAAYAWAQRLEPRKTDVTTHDMGFLFYPSFVRGYRITGDPWFRDAAVVAARSLATRFHEPGDYIQAWDEAEDPIHRGRTIVDTVMNLPLLLWAAEETGETRLREIALRVAETTIANHVRPDGSTYHVVDFDPEIGRAVWRGTHQGLHDESYWTRGQAWAIYGFASIARIAMRPDLRAVAEQLADFFVGQANLDEAPPWDFAAQGAGVPRDAAAGAIAADGLLDLAAAGGIDADLRRQQALRLLDALVATCTDDSASPRQGLLLHATADLPRNSAVDESLMYG